MDFESFWKYHIRKILYIYVFFANYRWLQIEDISMALYQKDFEKLLFKNDLLIYSFFYTKNYFYIQTFCTKMAKFCFIVDINFAR